ncbi:MAG: hypothetical protein HW421_3685 [Ignavibacteria bacterium]|nr:hypothetical protein [Ignavibacteria bacterium]
MSKNYKLMVNGQWSMVNENEKCNEGIISINPFILKILIQTIFLIVIMSLNIHAQPNKPSNTSIEPGYFMIKDNYEKILKSKVDSYGENNNWIHRWLWNNRMDFYPDGRFIRVSQEELLTQGKTLGKKDNHILSQYNWIPVGPINIPPSYEPRSCYSMGRVNCIAFHPTNPDIFWIGTPGGGIWKTVNSGKSWIPLSDKLSTLAISYIAVDPKNPDILYAATGDFDTGGMSDANAQGVFKSSDGGLTWGATSLLGESTFKSSLLKKIIINPQNTAQLITAGKRGIWKSTDEGITWKSVCDSTIMDLEMNPKEPNILYNAFSQIWGTRISGIMKSTDFGDSWIELNSGLPRNGEVSRIDLAVSPVDPEYLYAICVNSRTNGFHSFYSSTDAGNSWIRKAIMDSTNNMLGAWGADSTDIGGQGSYDLVLLPDPVNKNKLYSGGVNIWISDNGGSDWDIASFWIYSFGVSIHADHHFAAYNQLDKKFYWCNDGGVYRTKEILPGSKTWIRDWIDKHNENTKPGVPDFKFPTVWENLSDGLAITEFYRMSLCKNTPNVLAAGSQDNSCYYYSSGDWLNYIPNYDGMETMIAHDNPKVFYGVWQFGGLCKTTDGGKTLSVRLADTISNKERGAWITPTAMDPFNSETIFIGFKNLWRSKNGGYFWERMNYFDSLAPLSNNKGSLTIVKVSPVNAGCLSIFKEIFWYRDSTQTWKPSPGELWITEDSCKTWKKSTNGLPVDSINIISLVYDNQDPKKIWAATYTYINKINTYLTTDGGDSWKDISKPVPPGILIKTIVHQPNSQRNTLYAGTNHGVYFTDDSSDKWEPFSENLPNGIINELEIQYGTNELFAATYGRGVWKTNLLPLSVEDDLPINSSFNIYPNPTKGEISINIVEPLHPTNDVKTLHATSLQIITIKLIDIMGRILQEKKFITETMPLTLNINPNLNEGIYFIQLESGGKNYSTKLIIKR